VNKIRLAVIFGGKSTEHEVSLVSGSAVINAADKEKYDIVPVGITKAGEWRLYKGLEGASGAAFDSAIQAIKTGKWTADSEPIDPWKLPEICDFALPILHGKNGEDGTIQGLFELLGIPYGGCGVLGSATAMDKTVAKKIFESEGLRQAPYVDFTSAEIGQSVIERINRELKYPLFVKPVNLGSSVGITKVTEPEELLPAIEYAKGFDRRFCVEQAVNKARELEISVMGNDDLFLGRVGEIVPRQAFYTYDAKYNDDSSELLIPAPIGPDEEWKIRKMASAAYKALGCCGFARCDFLMDGDTHDIYINEINTIPGFTEISMFPKLCIAAGMTYPQVIDRIVELGYERYNAENNR